jgi:hypothetical protein
VTNHCPFCGNYAYAQSVGDAYQLDCRYCEIQVEITKRAYVARCPDPVAVLDYIRERLKVSTRPRVDLKDMKRLRETLTFRQEEEMTATDDDALTTAAKAIGTTLGKIAVKTGIATPPATAPRVVKKVATAKKAAAKKKTPAAKAATGVKGKAAPKKSAPKRKQGK